MSAGNPFHRRETRRQFVKKTGTITAAIAGAKFLPLSLSAASGEMKVPIVLDASDELSKDPSVNWAAEQLREALIARKVNADVVAWSDVVLPADEAVLVTGRNSRSAQRAFSENKMSLPDAPESFALIRWRLSKGAPLMIAGSDVRGLVYALLDLADLVSCARDPLAELKSVKSTIERPANQIRSVGRLFASDVQDKPWFNDREFWSRYLTMLATNRFNRINLTFGLGYDFTTDITDCYFHFAYPFLLSVPGYNVRAVPLPDDERDSNLEMLRFISDEAARRGLQFQLGLWTHAYRWTNSPRANYVIEGLTPETQGPYSRDALRLLLTRCPNITGVTIRTHGESGVAEANTEIWKTIFDGVAQCGRKVEIDLHAKGISQPIIDAALATGMPVNISPKFWAEHMGLPYMQGAIRPNEMPPRNANDSGFFSRSTGSRSFLRYGYGDLLAENRRYGVLHRIWPGTQRVLLWGDPEFAASYARVANFCGSNGVEIYEPLSFKGRKGSGLPGGRNAYAEAILKPKFDFEKYDYTYRVWGRNLYNPESDADGWRRLLRKQFASGADHAEAALSSAGKILPLVTTAHCPSAANNLYWPEMYWNMPMTEAVHPHPYSDTPKPKRFGTTSPLDPEFFMNCDEFADELLKGEHSGKRSPAWVSARLEDYAGQALAAVRKLKVRDSNDADFRRLKTDATIQAGLGNFFAAKFRAGVFYSLYLRTNDAKALQEAIAESRAARAKWAELADIAKGVYRDDVTYGPDYYQRGHWLDRLAAMDEDIADMEKLLVEPTPAGGSKIDLEKIRRAMRETSRSELSWKAGEHTHPPLDGFHTPPASFHRGEGLVLTVQAPPSSSFVKIAGMELRYRRVDQSELWQEIPMQKVADEFRATIPAPYTDSSFPLQYYFRIRRAPGEVVLRPGLETRFNGQPYFVVRTA
jgi:hypothetical protein